MNIIAKPCAVATCALLLVAPWAHSAELINTGTPSGGLINSITVDANNWIAERFTLTQAAQVASVSAYLASTDEGNDIGTSVTLAIYANDASSNLPSVDWSGTQLGHLYQTTLTFNGEGWSSANNLGWSLVSGAYWFAIEADGNGPSSLQLPTGTAHLAESVAYYSGGASYSTAGMQLTDSFGLTVTAVPEPSSIVLLLAGAGVLMLRRPRRA